MDANEGLERCTETLGTLAVDDGRQANWYGNFGSATNFAVGTGPVDLVVQDFDNDGKVDIATVNRDSGDVSILLNDGSGNFSNATGSPFSVSHTYGKSVT